MIVSTCRQQGVDNSSTVVLLFHFFGGCVDRQTLLVWQRFCELCLMKNCISSVSLCVCLVRHLMFTGIRTCHKLLWSIIAFARQGWPLGLFKSRNFIQIKRNPLPEVSVLYAEYTTLTENIPSNFSQGTIVCKFTLKTLQTPCVLRQRFNIVAE